MKYVIIAAINFVIFDEIIIRFFDLEWRVLVFPFFFLHFLLLLIMSKEDIPITDNPTINEEVTMNEKEFCFWCGDNAPCRNPHCPGDMTEVLDMQDHEPAFCNKHGYEVPCKECKAEQEAHAAICNGCYDCIPF